MTIDLPNDALLVVERDDRIEAHLNRPATNNAISQDVLLALHTVLDSIDEQPRFLIITGSDNGVFASGADLRELRQRRAADALAGPNVRLYERLRRSPLPTVAAVDGYALGGGAELAMACDLRVATAHAVFGQPEAALGLLAAGGGTYRLRALVGDSIARQVVYLGRRLSGTEALQAGLVDATVDTAAELMPYAHQMVDRMTKATHLALRMAKLALALPNSAHPEFDIVAQGLLYEEGTAHQRISEFLASRATPRPAQPTP